MKTIFRKKETSILIPFELSKKSIFNKIVEIIDDDLIFPGTIIINPRIEQIEITSTGAVQNVVTVDDVEIFWTLNNLTKNMKVMDGVGYKSLSNMEVGLYSVVYKPINGYKTPNTEIKTLKGGELIKFESIYEIGDDENVIFGTININMNIVVGGWKIDLLDENNQILLSIPMDGYSNVQEFVQGGLPFGKYRLSVKDLGVDIISPRINEFEKILSNSSSSITWNIVYANENQFQSKVSVIINDESKPVLWKLKPKYREDDEIFRAGTLMDYPVFIPQNGDVWRFAVSDEIDDFDKYVVKVNNKYLDKEISSKEFRYGYYDDELFFSLTSNNVINVVMKNFANSIINNLEYTFGMYAEQSANNNTAYNHGGRTVWYDGLEITINRFWSRLDSSPSETQSLTSFYTSPSVGGLYMPSPRYSENNFNYGWFRVSVNKSGAILTLYNLIKDNNGFIIGTELIKSMGVGLGNSYNEFFLIDTNIPYPVIDISEGYPNPFN